jgi:hypothetical protein
MQQQICQPVRLRPQPNPNTWGANDQLSEQSDNRSNRGRRYRGPWGHIRPVGFSSDTGEQ